MENSSKLVYYYKLCSTINKISNFFQLDNCRVYCDYFHSSERKFENPEERLLHFMEKIFSPDWVWREQYPDSNFENISMDEFDRRLYYFFLLNSYLSSLLIVLFK